MVLFQQISNQVFSKNHKENTLALEENFTNCFPA